MSIHGDVADLCSSSRVSLSGLDLDRLPPQYNIIIMMLLPLSLAKRIPEKRID